MMGNCLQILELSGCQVEPNVILGPSFAEFQQSSADSLVDLEEYFKVIRSSGEMIDIDAEKRKGVPCNLQFH